MNKYGSVVRRLIAKNVLEQVMPVIPAPLQVANAGWKRVFARYKIPATATDYLRMNVNSNINILSAGLFCNFADGLVLATPANRILLPIYAASYAAVATLTGTVTFTIGSKALTGAGTGFVAELGGAPTPVVVRDALGNLYFIDSVTNDTNAVLTEYATVTNVTAAAQRFGEVGTIGANLLSVTNLNMMMSAERPIPNASISSTAAEQIGIVVNPSNDNTATTVDFLTKTIDATYAGDTSIWDVLVDVEFTYTP